MKSPKIQILAGVLATTALILAGCSSGDGGDSGVETVTTTVSVPTSVAPVSPVSPVASGSQVVEKPAASTKVQAQESALTEAVESFPASKVRPVPRPADFNGMPVTICGEGEGFGISQIAANEHASCEFAMATVEAIVAGHNSANDNVRSLLPTTVNVYSPVTGQYYDMYCEIVQSGIGQCIGGNDALVFFY